MKISKFLLVNIGRVCLITTMLSLVGCDQTQNDNQIKCIIHDDNDGITIDDNGNHIICP